MKQTKLPHSMNPPIAKALNRCIVKLSPGCTGTRFKNSTAQRLLTAGLCLFLNFALSIFNTAGQPTNNIRPGSSALMVDTNGVLIAPTNFFSANSNRLNTAVSGGGGGGSGSVTNFSTGAFPAWLTPSVTGATSNPALSIAGNSAMSNLNNGNGAALTNLNAPRLTRTNINLINQPFTGANGTLPAGWAYSKGLGSTGTAYITNNALVITNAVGTPAWNWVYDTNVFNGSHNFSMHCNFSIKQTNGVADALVMGTKSGNPQDDASWGIGAYLMPGAYTGTLIFYGGPSTNLATFRPSDTGSASSNAYPVTITIGTSYGFDIQVDDDSVAASVSNTVTGEVSTFAWKQDVSITTGTNGYFGCSGYFGVQSWGGSFSVTNFQV